MSLRFQQIENITAYEVDIEKGVTIRGMEEDPHLTVIYDPVLFASHNSTTAVAGEVYFPLAVEVRVGGSAPFFALFQKYGEGDVTDLRVPTAFYWAGRLYTAYPFLTPSAQYPQHVILTRDTEHPKTEEIEPYQAAHLELTKEIIQGLYSISKEIEGARNREDIPKMLINKFDSLYEQLATPLSTDQPSQGNQSSQDPYTKYLADSILLLTLMKVYDDFAHGREVAWYRSAICPVTAGRRNGRHDGPLFERTHQVRNRYCHFDTYVYLLMKFAETLSVVIGKNLEKTRHNYLDILDINSHPLLGMIYVDADDTETYFPASSEQDSTPDKIFKWFSNRCKRVVEVFSTYPGLYGRDVAKDSFRALMTSLTLGFATEMLNSHTVLSLPTVSRVLRSRSLLPRLESEKIEYSNRLRQAYAELAQSIETVEEVVRPLMDERECIGEAIQKFLEDKLYDLYDSMRQVVEDFERRAKKHAKEMVSEVGDMLWFYNLLLLFQQFGNHEDSIDTHPLPGDVLAVVSHYLP